MKVVRLTIVLCFLLFAAACGEEREVRSPVDTLKKYANAIKEKDTTQMKLLLSAATLKLHSEQAKAQKVTLDEIVQRETFFPPDQRIFAYKNEKVEGDKATVEVKNTFGGWDQIFLVRENGGWKIDKKGTAQQMIDQSDKDVQKLDDQIDADRKKIEEQLDLEDENDPLKQTAPTKSPSQDEIMPPDPTADSTIMPPHSTSTRNP